MEETSNDFNFQVLLLLVGMFHLKMASVFGTELGEFFTIYLLHVLIQLVTGKFCWKYFLYDKYVRCKDVEIAWVAEYVRNMLLFAFVQTPKAYYLWKEK